MEKDDQEKKNQDLAQQQNDAENKLYELNLQLEELNVQMEANENALLKNPDDLLLKTKKASLKETYKEKARARKLLIQDIRHKESKLNQISLWIIIYGTLMVVLSFPLIAGSLWLLFTKFVINVLQETIADIRSSWLAQIIIFLTVFSLPLLLNLLNWLLRNNLLKTKVDKKAFAAFWIVQGVMQLGMIIYISVKIYG